MKNIMMSVFFALIAIVLASITFETVILIAQGLISNWAWLFVAFTTVMTAFNVGLIAIINWGEPLQA
jgi:hypothetical protein